MASYDLENCALTIRGHPFTCKLSVRHVSPRHSPEVSFDGKVWRPDPRTYYFIRSALHKDPFWGKGVARAALAWSPKLRGRFDCYTNEGPSLRRVWLEKVSLGSVATNILCQIVPVVAGLVSATAEGRAGKFGIHPPSSEAPQVTQGES